jgi:2-haloacid dehalogenase
VKDYKPSFSHFRHFYRVSGVATSDWVHVACSYFHDIEPAKALGVKRIWIDRDRTGEDRSAANAWLPDARGLATTVTRLMDQSA